MNSNPPAAAHRRFSFLASWGSYLLILLAGTWVFLWKLEILAVIKFIGFGDPAAYSEMACSLLDGRGLEVDYISMHFRQFAAAISHPEETWPPLYSFLIVPFFACMGKSALAAKLPCLVVSCFLFPSAVLALARRAFGSPLVAFASALTVLLYAPFAEWSLQANADITFGFLITVVLLFVLKGLDDSRWFFPAWALLGLAYYGKSSALVVAGALAVHYLLRRLFGARKQGWTGPDLHFVLALALFAALLMPWFIRNSIHFSDPFFCNHKHVAGYVGWDTWEDRTYTVYWDEQPPSLLDKFREPGRLLSTGYQSFLLYGRQLFVEMNSRLHMKDGLSPGMKDGPSPGAGDKIRIAPFAWGNYSTYLFGFPALAGIALFLITSLGHRFKGKSRPSLGRDSDEPNTFSARRTQTSSTLSARALSSDRDRAFSTGPARAFFTRPAWSLFLLVFTALLFFLSLIWFPLSRLTTPLVPLVVIMGWGTLHWFLCLLFRAVPFGRGAAALALILLLGLWTHHESMVLRTARANDTFPWSEIGGGVMDMGAWIRDHLPGAVIMTKNPWDLHFYCDRKTVRLPRGPMIDVLRVARHYGVTHIIPDNRDPKFLRWIQDADPGLRQVHKVMNFKLFAIDYDRIPEEYKSWPRETNPRDQ